MDEVVGIFKDSFHQSKVTLLIKKVFFFVITKKDRKKDSESFIFQILHLIEKEIKMMEKKTTVFLGNAK